ncbi:MAG: HNH endonuclease [Desulfovibrio sp.]|nr:HNH endonuclease [Desulfovibrio sp.]
MSLKNTSLCGYGAKALKRDKYKCKYCGFDGSTFDNWLQMSVDHVIPVSATDTPDHSIDNLVACCKACNSFTSRMDIDPKMSIKEVIAKKKAHVKKRRLEFKKFWDANQTK